MRGSPVLTTTATSSSPLGTYPIALTAGTLSAANYTFNPVGGTLTVVQSTTQTISFAPLADATYGAAPITLNATSSASLGVSYTVTGPATLSGKVLTINGSGTVSVTAHQAGNSIYWPAAPVTQSFSVSPAVLTVKANDAQRPNNTPDPTFTYGITGYVNNETQGIALSGTPALSTTATIASAPGTYFITPAAGTLKAANYTFSFVSGTLTIDSGGRRPTSHSLLRRSRSW
jgi:hypothetical protein